MMTARAARDRHAVRSQDEVRRIAAGLPKYTAPAMHVPDASGASPGRRASRTEAPPGIGPDGMPQYRAAAMI